MISKNRPVSHQPNRVSASDLLRLESFLTFFSSLLFLFVFCVVFAAWISSHCFHRIVACQSLVYSTLIPLASPTFACFTVRRPSDSLSPVCKREQLKFTSPAHFEFQILYHLAVLQPGWDRLIPWSLVIVIRQSVDLSIG